MVDLPGAIIFVNDDLTKGVQDPLTRQLYITDTMDGYEFDNRVALNPNYPLIIHSNNLRVLVIRSFYDGYNRNLADVVIFIKAGLASIESNRFGPPGQTFPVDNLNIYKLLANYPPQGSCFITSDGIQNNILVPLYPYAHTPKLYPFGSDPPTYHCHIAGALIPTRPIPSLIPPSPENILVEGTEDDD